MLDKSADTPVTGQDRSDVPSRLVEAGDGSQEAAATDVLEAGGQGAGGQCEMSKASGITRSGT